MSCGAIAFLSLIFSGMEDVGGTLKFPSGGKEKQVYACMRVDAFAVRAWIKSKNN